MRFGLFSNGQGTRNFETTAQAWRSDIDEIVLAEKLGLGQAWISEHRATFLRDALSTPELMVAKAAALTQTIRFGTAVRRLGFYPMPVQVAREAACTDVLTDGRYTLGVGTGPTPPGVDQYAMGLEALDLIERALTEDEAFDFDGAYYQDKGVLLQPKPHQTRLPIAVASTTPSVVGRAASRGWSLLTSQWSHPNSVRRVASHYNQMAREAGRGSSLGQVTATRGLYIADTDERAYAEVTPALREHLDYTLRHFSFSLAEYAPPGGTVHDITVEHLIDSGMIFVGSPETVTERISQFYDQCGGFGEFLIVGGKDWGDLDQRNRSFELFATKVMPRLAHLDADADADALAAARPVPAPALS